MFAARQSGCFGGEMSNPTKFPGGTEFKRYNIPSQKGEGWSVVFLDPRGIITTVSDYGNYGYWFGEIGGDGDIRRFLCQCDDDYLVRKLAPKEVYDGEATKKGILKHIREHRREKFYTKEFARKEWDLATGDWANPEDDFRAWYEETEIGDASEFWTGKHDPRAVAFCEKVMPRLREMLRAELAAEKQAA